MKHTICAAILGMAVAAAPALAQSEKPSPSMKASQPSKTGTSGKTTLSAADRAFAREAAIGGMAEVDLGNLAKEKASNADVKQFGDRMVTDHSKANDELKSWASGKNMTLPTELDAKHKATHDRLAKLSGDAFDKAYMRDMLTDHREDVAAFKKASTSSHDEDLKSWAGKTLPTLEDHLKAAEDAAGKVGVAGAKPVKK